MRSREENFIFLAIYLEYFNFENLSENPNVSIICPHLNRNSRKMNFSD